MSKVLQLKIMLLDSLVRRRVLVEDKTSFHRLHKIIQVTMGWEGYHLYMFKVGDKDIGLPDPEYDSEVHDSRKTSLAMIKVKEFLYTYDFGDTWEHSIIIEKILEKDKSKKYPLCIDGAMACPPEDCGGTFGYQRMLKALNDKNDKEHKMWSNWISGSFNPEEFDKAKINRKLRKL